MLGPSALALPPTPPFRNCGPQNKGKDAAGRPVPAGAQAVVSYGQYLGKRPSTAPPGSPKAKRKVAPLEAKRTAYNG